MDGQLFGLEIHVDEFLVEDFLDHTICLTATYYRLPSHQSTEQSRRCSWRGLSMVELMDRRLRVGILLLGGGSVHASCAHPLSCDQQESVQDRIRYK